MKPQYFLISAYGVIWLFVLVYVLSLALRIRDMSRDIEDLKKK